MYEVWGLTSLSSKAGQTPQLIYSHNDVHRYRILSKKITTNRNYSLSTLIQHTVNDREGVREDNSVNQKGHVTNDRGGRVLNLYT